MKKHIIFILSIILIFVLVSCSTNEPREAKENEIIDASGSIIEIPENPMDAKIATVYAVAAPFLIALDISDQVVACNTKKAFYKEQDLGLSKSGNCGNGVVDLELLLRYSPTVFIHRNNDPRTVEKVKNLGIDVITISVENISDVINTLLILGKYFNKEERANYVINWINEQFDYIDNIVSTIKDSEKKTALLMGSTLGRVSGSDMLQSWMIEKAGGISIVDIGSNHDWINIGTEKIFEYNPDYLFLTSSSSLNYTKNDILNDDSWKTLNSVKNDNVYQIPAVNDSWDMPGLSPVLGTLYMLYKMYPTYLSKEDFIDKIDEYYSLMFNKTFDSEELGYEL